MALSRRTIGAFMLTGGIIALAINFREMKREQADEASRKAARAAEEAASKPAQQPASLTQVVALWTGQPVPGEPMGVHVADVSVDTAGAVTLLLADNTTTRASVEAALSQARALPALPYAAPAASTAPAPGTPAAAPGTAKPGEPQYAQAVAEFLAAKTGFKPRLEAR